MRGMNFNEDWKFYLGEPKAAHLRETDDASWRTLRLPHDWSVEHSFTEEGGPQQVCRQQVVYRVRYI